MSEQSRTILYSKIQALRYMVVYMLAYRFTKEQLQTRVLLEIKEAPFCGG